MQPHKPQYNKQTNKQKTSVTLQRHLNKRQDSEHVCRSFWMGLTEVGRSTLNAGRSGPVGQGNGLNWKENGSWVATFISLLPDWRRNLSWCFTLLPPRLQHNGLYLSNHEPIQTTSPLTLARYCVKAMGERNTFHTFYSNDINSFFYR